MARLVIALLLFQALLAATLDASPGPQARGAAAVAEARVVLKVIAGRLQEKYTANPSSIDPNWTLAGLGITDSQLQGSFFDADDYSMSFPLGNSTRARLVCRGPFAQRRGMMALEVDLATHGKSWCEPEEILPSGLDEVMPVSLSALFTISVVSAPIAFGVRIRRRKGMSAGQRLGLLLNLSGLSWVLTGTLIFQSSGSLDERVALAWLPALLGALGFAVGAVVTFFGALFGLPHSLGGKTLMCASALLAGCAFSVATYGFGAVVPYVFGGFAAVISGGLFLWRSHAPTNGGEFDAKNTVANQVLS